MSFKAPTRDLAFSLTAAAGLMELTALPRFKDLDLETVRAVLEGAGALTEEVLAPLNAGGDRVGARLEADGVRSPPGFAQAYSRYCEGGWSGLSADLDVGGQGLPKALSLAVFEMIHAANMAFGLCPMLSEAAIEALSIHGTPRQKALYLTHLVSGDWTGTMNLTEPQAGSDLSLLSARAEPDGEGGYRLTGQKIYITWGDHDLAENICHLVLARLPDAPAGVKGISLFLAPKRLVHEDGSLGDLNTLRAASLERKLGIHGSPTCVMLFEGARAELVGREHQGLAHMFTMMNAARLNVGAEGVGIAERAFQGALAYALERRQGRSAWSNDPVCRIYDHPDVRKGLGLIKSRIEAGRAICLATAVAADKARYAEDEGVREAASLREELLTPIAKAWCTDMGVEAASSALQVYGGMGFIEDTGAAQHYRDARITPIYEGTNGVQAIDLAGRKLGLKGGAAVEALFREIAADAGVLRSPQLRPVGERLLNSLEAARGASAYMSAAKGSADALAGAGVFLKLMGDLVGGHLLAKAAAAALETEDAAFANSRVALARLYADQVLVGSHALAAAAQAGSGDLEALTADALQT